MDMYTKKVIHLASNIPHSRRLTNPSVTITKRTPICGSSITIDMLITDGKIVEFGQKINACALGQASASIVTSNIIGTTKSDVEKLLHSVSEMLTANGNIPKKPYQEFEALIPAKKYKNRHASIMLILTTIVEAFKQFEKKVPTNL
tara:strand:- start:52 stop:489 length:438 start_codon:yes stop_codon:yes gene_type:complete